MRTTERPHTGAFHETQAALDLQVLSGAALALLLATGGAYGQSGPSRDTRSQSLQPNRTQGFAAGKIVTFTYQQNFDCVTQPRDDLDYNGKPAQSDSDELQTPICRAGVEPSMNPAGQPTEDGSTGITSLARLHEAEAAGDATGVPSNFFLFFSSRSMDDVKGMHHHD